MLSIPKLQIHEVSGPAQVSSLNEVFQSGSKNDTFDKTQKLGKEHLQLPLKKLSFAQLAKITITESILGQIDEVDLPDLCHELGKEAFGQVLHDVIVNFPCTKGSNQQLCLFLDNLVTEFPELQQYLLIDDLNGRRMLQPDGMRLVIQHSQDEKMQKCIVCSTFLEFQTALESTSSFPQPFIFYDQAMHHYMSLYVTKEKETFHIFSSDSVFATDAVLKYLKPELSSHIKHIFYAPQTTILDGPRQTRIDGCDFFALHDVKCWIRNPTLTLEIQKNALIQDQVATLPWEEFYSQEMVRSTQSLELIRQYKTKQVERIRLTIFEKEERKCAIETLKNEFNRLNTKLDKHILQIDGKHQNWYIEKQSRKGLAKVIAYVFSM